MRLSWRERLADEQGGMILAFLVVTISALLLLALGQTIEGGLRSSLTDQDRTEAFHQADAGIDLALYRLDTGQYTGGSFTETVIVDESTFTVTAEQKTPGADHTWVLRSVALNRTSGQRRSVVATAITEPLFPYAFFTLGDFSITGAHIKPVAYDSSTCPTAQTGCELAPTPGGLGTNGRFVTDTQAKAVQFAASWASLSMHGRPTQATADAACATGWCGTAPKVIAEVSQLELERPPVPGAVQSCPYGGTIGTVTLVPGDYACDHLDLQGTITVGTGGNLTGQVRIWVNGSVSAAATSVVNRNGKTSAFQVLQAVPENGLAVAGSICGSEIWGLLFTPGLVIDCQGVQPRLYGAVVANSFRVVDTIKFHWDVAATSVSRDGSYTLTDWRECPPNAETC